jgi:dimethylargininase
MLKTAIVRPPGRSFVRGLSVSGLGAPDVKLAGRQHQAYCEALESCGLRVAHLPADERYPDSTFVEDVAVLIDGCAVLTRPGAESRRGEVESIRGALQALFDHLLQIEAPGTLDGGDVCQTDRGWYIGVSARTNEAGAQQLAGLLEVRGHQATLIDIRKIPGLLHLKSGIAALGEGVIVLDTALRDRPEFAGFKTILVDASESYAANCIRVNDRVVVAEGYPRFQAALAAGGFDPLPVDVSEFRKMDGGVSCLSLRC